MIASADSRHNVMVSDALTEEALLRGLEMLPPMVPSAGGGTGSEGQASQVEHHQATLKGATMKGK